MNQDNFIKYLKEINIEIDDLKLNQLKTYYEMLVEYNKVMNLTGITEKEQVYLKHFYDSLTINKIINLNEVDILCDIGTGAGFPGLVIKILFPKIKITLVDSLNKRINFLNDVINRLNLKDIEAVHARIEEYGILNREKYDVVTCRAVASLNILLEYAIPMVKVGKYFIPMKGNLEKEPDISKALDKLNAKLVKKEEFSLPFENSTRTILMFEKQEKTNKLFPRKYSVIKNKPL